MPPGTAETVKKQLTEICKNSKEHVDMQRLMTRYAIERFLWRVGKSKHADQFVLKGAMALPYYVARSRRTTKDADFMMRGQDSPERIRNLLTDIARIKADDGVKFKSNAITVRRAGDEKANSAYAIRIPASLGMSVCPVDVDISFGEAVHPNPVRVSIPALLSGKARFPLLFICPIEMIIAEKYQTIVRLGMSNTRLKDHHDLFEISQSTIVDGGSLQQAIRATFERRGTPIEATIPTGLSDSFTSDKTKQREWKATLTRHNMPRGTSFEEASEWVISMVMPALSAIINHEPFNLVWDKRKWRPAPSSS